MGLLSRLFGRSDQSENDTVYRDTERDYLRRPEDEGFIERADDYDNPTVDKPEIPEITNWHDIDTLPDGARVGRLGAMWYLLNSENEAISLGYHTIRRGAGGYEGKTGARKYNIEVNGRIDYQ